MQSFRLTSPGRTELVEVPKPSAGPRDVVLRVGSASFCHSDVTIVGLPVSPFAELPVTLGHEIAGWIDEVGSDVQGLAVGEAVAVHIIHGCGVCSACASGRDNLCASGFRSPGVHYDGGLAEYVSVPARSVVPLDGVDMMQASALTDAGVTSYHSLDLVRHRLSPTSTVVVVGCGGLGHLAVQIAAATTGASVVAVDVRREQLDLAAELGAVATFLNDDQAAERIRDFTGGRGVAAVLDYVGSQDTVDLAAQIVAPGGGIVITGIGGGEIGMSGSLHEGGGVPRPQVSAEVAVTRSFGGSIEDLRACLALARRGLLRVETTLYGLDAAQSAYDALASGSLRGRAVVVPHEQLVDA